MRNCTLRRLKKRSMSLLSGSRLEALRGQIDHSRETLASRSEHRLDRIRAFFFALFNSSSGPRFSDAASLNLSRM